MPNWAEGVLKIRGTRQDIKTFLVNGLGPVPNISSTIAKLMGKEVKEPEVKINEYDYEFEMCSPNGFYIKGTSRAFIDSNINWWFEDSHLEVLTIDSFKQAWGVDATEFATISKKYNLDIKIYVFEKGMEFNQDIEIHKGEIIKNNEIKFDDYEWECLFPNLGG